MSAFQSAFHCIKENEKMTDRPEFSEAEGEVKTTGSSEQDEFSLDFCLDSDKPLRYKKDGVPQCEGSLF